MNPEQLRLNTDLSRPVLLAIITAVQGVGTKLSGGFAMISTSLK
jgi:hypothetical protein